MCLQRTQNEYAMKPHMVGTYSFYKIFKRLSDVLLCIIYTEIIYLFAKGCTAIFFLNTGPGSV